MLTLFKESSVSIDEDYYERLIAPLENQMIRSIWRIVRDPDDADDALQEALTTIWRRLDRIRRHPNPHALILKICVNAAYDILRKRIRVRRHEELKEIESQVKDQRPLASDAITEKERKAEILRAIGRLPRHQAQAVLMRIVEEQPYSVIAQALQCNENTARTHVKRGRARLTQLLSHLLPQPAREVSNL
jgi:RNA polymerase sigma-70 factor (ECF subfamily)